MLSTFDILILIFLGSALGFFGGLFGIGGGLIAIPIFMIAFGMDQSVAQGTALVLMVPNLLIGWWRYSKKHPINWRATYLIAIPATTTTVLISMISADIHPAVLRSLFSICLVAFAWRLLSPANHSDENEHSAIDFRKLPLIGVLGGISMGLLNIGGGLVATPLLSGWMKQRQTVAQSLSMALVAPSSIAALVSHAGSGQVEWKFGLILAFCGLFTVSAGVAFAHRLPEKQMRSLFAILLIGTAFSIAIRS